MLIQTASHTMPKMLFRSNTFWKFHFEHRFTEPCAAWHSHWRPTTKNAVWFYLSALNFSDTDGCSVHVQFDFFSSFVCLTNSKNFVQNHYGSFVYWARVRHVCIITMRLLLLFSCFVLSFATVVSNVNETAFYCSQQMCMSVCC